MEEKRWEMMRAFARLLKPGPGKVAVFALLFFMLALLPLYPVHRDRYIGPAADDMRELESSGTSVTSLYCVLEGNLNWTQTDIVLREMGLFVRFPEYHVSYYDANPAFLAVYGLLGFLMYSASCYYVESERLEKKARQ